MSTKLPDPEDLMYEGLELGESEVVNGWLRQGYLMGQLEQARESILILLDEYFPNQISAEVRQLVSSETSLAKLDVWFDEVVAAGMLARYIERRSQ